MRYCERAYLELRLRRNLFFVWGKRNVTLRSLSRQWRRHDGKWAGRFEPVTRHALQLPRQTGTNRQQPPPQTYFRIFISHLDYCWTYALFAANGARVKRQEDDSDGPDQSPEELCTDRPADEYFRLSTEGDCRDVVRWYELHLHFDDIQWDILTFIFSLKYEEKR